MKLSEYLFKDFEPCSSHNCIVKKPKGMGTNGSCCCLSRLTRAQLRILNGRLGQVANKEVAEPLLSAPVVDIKKCMHCGHVFSFHEVRVVMKVKIKPKGTPHGTKIIGYACDNGVCDN